MPDSTNERMARRLSELAPHRYKARSASGAVVPGAVVPWEKLRESDRDAFRTAATDLLTAMRRLDGAEAARFARDLWEQNRKSGQDAAIPRGWLALIEAARSE